MMSQVGHNVHNVTSRLLIIVEKAQLIDIERRLCNLGIIIIHTLVKIYLPTLYDCDCFYEYFASHITRPPSKYDVRLNNTAYNSIQINNVTGMSDLETR